MERFVIYSKEFGYFKAGAGGSKSLQYNETDFVDTVENAGWYKTESKAFEMSTNLYKQFKTNCVRILITIDELDTIPTKKQIAKKLAECVTLVKATDALSDKEVEKIPEREWQNYLVAKRYIENHSNSEET